MIASLNLFKEQNSAYRLAPSTGDKNAKRKTSKMQNAKCKVQNERTDLILNLES
jgi:hypothetical protein